MATVSDPLEAANPAVRPARLLRAIVARTQGRPHGPVTRIVSPGELGELIKPFVFLDYFDFTPSSDALFPMHPHSGIATITVLLSGNLRYEDTTGASGELSAGSVEWMNAGNGIWHDASPADLERFHGYQMWVALPREVENGEPQTQYLPAQAIPHVGPARVILGSYGNTHSPVTCPEGINYLHVRLKAGEQWRYVPPVGHTVAWTHVHRGTLCVAGERLRSELAVFNESEDALDFAAETEAEFIFASAVKHPHDLVLGYYSVHTSEAALQAGEAQIARIGEQLRFRGRIR
ncbi:pirin family protein [Paraburkholderia aromaticivorans]|uniref:pirin family protein n=1 Tax=Paraburkholderia aromaticivorans TaxID=2026199 RepID=UPI001455E094|nr:pirin family protein [Paraburkholderia aromaticivorans]